MQLAGGGIDMDRAVGRAWIDGPGDVTLPMKRNLSGTPLGRPELVTIQWKQGMDFDGRAVECSGDVLARTRSQTLWTDLLKITLTPTLTSRTSSNTRKTCRPVSLRGSERALGESVDRRERARVNQ